MKGNKTAQLEITIVESEDGMFSFDVSRRGGGRVAFGFANTFVMATISAQLGARDAGWENLERK